MIIAGKCPPEREDLKAASEKGLENVELYLEKQHLDSFDESLENCREAEVQVVSIHTPHVSLEEKEYLLEAGKLADELDAFLVFHSGAISLGVVPNSYGMDLKAETGYEYNVGVSTKAVKNIVLSEGKSLVLDVAHLFIAEENYLEKIEYLLENYSEQIPLIHLNDSTRKQDGLGFGEGEMDMEAVCKIIDRKFDGIVVLEVMPEKQEEALEKWRDFTS